MIFARALIAVWHAARLISAGVITIGSTAFAQPESQSSGRVQAEVVTPIRVVPLSNLSFGSIVVGSSGEGAVEVAPDGSPARYFNAARPRCSGESDCMPHRASFEVSGEPGRSYRVSWPQQIIAYGLRSGVGLPVTRLEVRSVNASSTSSEKRLDNAGRDRFFVGGTLRVPAGTHTDVFRAELPVIVSYN